MLFCWEFTIPVGNDSREQNLTEIVNQWTHLPLGDRLNRLLGIWHQWGVLNA